MVRLGQSILNRLLNTPVGICPTSGCLTPDVLRCLRKPLLGVMMEGRVQHPDVEAEKADARLFSPRQSERSHVTYEWPLVAPA